MTALPAAQQEAGPARRPGGEARRGARDVLPMLLGYAPFAMILGTTIATHRDAVAAWAGTGLIYGGAAHLAMLGPLNAGSGAAAAIMAGLLVNVRLLVYSATLVPSWRTAPRWRRAVAAALLTDAVWALAVRQDAEPVTDAQRRRYYLGAASTLWLGWLAMVTAATVTGSGLALGSYLALAPSLCLLALIGPALRAPATRAAACLGAVVALIGHTWPGGTGLLVAVAAGTLAGLLTERKATP